MGFLKLGVACVVLDDEKRLLLSKRTDFDVWNLPTGRLDKGEWLSEAASRETREETGVEVDIVRPVGLYFQVGRNRMNVLFEGRLSGGTLQANTDESQENAFFSLKDLPSNLFGGYMARDAVAGGVHLHVLEIPPDKLKEINRKLAVRWVKNLFSGRPEPRWARFGVQASLAVVNSQTGEILSERYHNGERVLAGLNVNGNTPIWEQVRQHTRDKSSLYELREASLRWVGLYHHKGRGSFEFIFATEITPHSDLKVQGFEWTPADATTWWEGYAPFVRHITQRKQDVKLINEG